MLQKAVFSQTKKLVPRTGLEPVSLAAADFKSAVYTIPPPGPTEGSPLYFLATWQYEKLA